MEVEKEKRPFDLLHNASGAADAARPHALADAVGASVEKDGVDGLVDAVEAADLQVHLRFLHWAEQVRRLQLTMVAEMSDDVRVCCRKMALAGNPNEVMQAQAELFQAGIRRAGTAHRDAWTAWTEMQRLLVDDLRVNARLVGYACFGTRPGLPVIGPNRGQPTWQTGPRAGLASRS